MYGLVDPNNNVIATEQNVDPNIQTKSGYMWLEIKHKDKPIFNEHTHKLNDLEYEVSNNYVYEVWSISSKDEDEINESKIKAVNNIDKVVLNALYHLYKLQVPTLTMQKFKEQLKSLI